jgi:hypothetical protein
MLDFSYVCVVSAFLAFASRVASETVVGQMPFGIWTSLAPCNGTVGPSATTQAF